MDVHRKVQCTIISTIFFTLISTRKYQVDVITPIDSEAMYIAFGSEKSVAICSLKLNSVGVETHFRKVQEYDNN